MGRYRLTAPRVPELAIHQQIAAVLRLELAPAGKLSPAGAVWWSCDIASYGGNTPGLRTSRGVIAGVWDVLLLYRGQTFCAEVKADDGALSTEQQNVGTAVLRAGGKLGVARNAQEMLALLDAWGIPRNHRTQVAA